MKSAVNLWEISVKTRIKKFDLGGLKVGDLIGVAEETSFQLISHLPEEAVTYETMGEDTHFDPFDRLLIRQAMRRNR